MSESGSYTLKLSGAQELEGDQERRAGALIDLCCDACKTGHRRGASFVRIGEFGHDVMAIGGGVIYWVTNRLLDFLADHMTAAPIRPRQPLRAAARPLGALCLARSQEPDAELGVLAAEKGRSAGG